MILITKLIKNMSKFTREISTELEKKVKDLATELGIYAWGLSIEVVGLKKSKKDVGVVIKQNDIAELFSGDNSTVVVALYEPFFDQVDEQTQEIWIRSLLYQIWYDCEKDKIVINKPEICLPVRLYKELGEVAVKKMELAYHMFTSAMEKESEN